MQDHQLVEAARAARLHAYAPYSRFTVGAALICDDGNVYTGANIENAVYPLGCCAERVALYQAINAGARRVIAVAVAGAPEGETVSGPCTPCGACRQTLLEFGGAEMRVLVAKRSGWDSYMLGDLLPESFSAANLSSSTGSTKGA